MTPRLSQKEAGAYYTPDPVVASLLSWGIRSEEDRLLDPSCGDGRFVAGHRNAVGIEQDSAAAKTAMSRAPWALIHEGDFFSWASETTERFECAVGNPPFIRYQTFKGTVRATAAALCARLGADFSGLASSWAPFLVATASLLKRGGRMSFVVPAEIGHAPYAAPLLEYLLAHFSVVHLVAVRDKLFPDLSEDCWLLHAEGFEGRADHLRFTVLDRFKRVARPPRQFIRIDANEWRTEWRARLRPYLLSATARDMYREIAAHSDSDRLGSLAAVGIGYVSGANDFFHLRPSEAEKWAIPSRFLHPTVRNGRALQSSRITNRLVENWKRDDEPILLLHLPKSKDIPEPVLRYLDTEAGHVARQAYKCRMREPWYSVPDVHVPDYFLTYMSGREAGLVRNDASCTCTNSVHAVRLKSPSAATKLAGWGTDFVNLSAELEGHPLGGGMLKLEPREATQILLPGKAARAAIDKAVAAEALQTLRAWRHYGIQA